MNFQFITSIYTHNRITRYDFAFSLPQILVKALKYIPSSNYARIQHCCQDTAKTHTIWRTRFISLALRQLQKVYYFPSKHMGPGHGRRCVGQKRDTKAQDRTNVCKPSRRQVFKNVRYKSKLRGPVKFQ